MFKDRKGRVWDVSFNYGDVIELRREVALKLKQSDIQAAGLDILDIDSVISCMSSDEHLLSVLYRLGKAEDRGVEFVDFCEGFDGDTFRAAVDAIWESIEAFSPSDRRPMIQTLVAKMKNVDRTELEAAMKRLNETSATKPDS